MSFLEELRKSKVTLKAQETVITTADGKKWKEEKQPDGSVIRVPVHEKSHGFIVDTKPDKELHKVIEGLFVGSQDAAINAEALQANNVKNILCVATGIETSPPEGVTVHKIPILDVDSEDLLSALDKCYETIDAAIKDGGVLIHCNAGISRAPSVTTAYLIKSQKLSFEDAFDKVKAARPQANPNPGFRVQLKKYAEINAS
eukprot:TRINITY_DN2698_c0_g2_i1.p1 TRINITY_DN2698_c0_g2~~TRINITY_DN2698_c0_g2_i1.p1  ORF type:complete len:201 (-),score=67.09 TRINITY_DN2698_c0_g2_i1:165-767(-)